MTRKPLLLLDVDGVIMPFGSIDLLGLRHVPTPYGGGLSYDPALPGWLEQLAGRFELCWATMWQHDANELVGPLLGLPPLPVIEFLDAVEPGFDLKLPAIRRFVGTRPCAWVDDTIGFDSHGWAKARTAPTLFLDVESNVGLTQTLVEQLLDFAKEALPSN